MRLMLRKLGPASFFAILLSKDFAHGHTTSILSTEACLFHCSGAEKTPGLISLVVDEAENMSQICVSNFTKSNSWGCEGWVL